MKKILLLLLIPVIFIGVFVFVKSLRSAQKILGTTSPSESPVQSKVLDFDFKDQTLSFYWYEIDDISKVNLIPNFDEKISIKDASFKYNCKFIVSSGFYTEEFSPTGLFIYEGEVLKKFRSNRLFNGIYSINFLETPRITRGVPKDPLRIALQSGPLLIENAQKLRLVINNDKKARRVIAANTGENKTVFIVVFEKDSYFSGPLLTDLPDFLEVFEQRTSIVLADAINLDGGTASGIYTNDFSLSEASPIGSFFCLTE